jgi:hypothetical protein
VYECALDCGLLARSSLVLARAPGARFDLSHILEKEHFMTRLLTLLAVAGLTAAVACGDDSGDKKGTTPTPDAGSSIDSGAKPVADTGTGVVARPIQVENPGAACTTATKADCKGPSATCNETIMVGQDNIKLPGGYCSAQCNATSECGTGGGCPAAEITASLPAAIVDLAGPLLTGLIPSSCLDKCDKTGPDVCRSGYECKTIGELIPSNLGAIAGPLTSGAAFKVAYCLPPIDLTPPDAGRPALPVDSGVRSGLDGGADSGL